MCLKFFNIVYKIFFIQIVSKPQIKVSIIIIGIIFLKHKSKTIENDLNIFCIIFKCPKNDINKKQPTRLQKLSKPPITKGRQTNKTIFNTFLMFIMCIFELIVIITL